jgi:hypothetical protein
MARQRLEHHAHRERVDTTPPTVALNGESSITIECHTSYSDAGATASDLCAGDLSNACPVLGLGRCNTPGSYTVSYQVSDGHVTTPAPAAPCTWSIHAADARTEWAELDARSSATRAYSDAARPPATCARVISRTVSRSSGSVDVNTPGSYTVSYQVSDGHGNNASASRTVHVVRYHAAVARTEWRGPHHRRVPHELQRSGRDRERSMRGKPLRIDSSVRCGWT